MQTKQQQQQQKHTPARHSNQRDGDDDMMLIEPDVSPRPDGCALVVYAVGQLSPMCTPHSSGAFVLWVCSLLCGC